MGNDGWDTRRIGDDDGEQSNGPGNVESRQDDAPAQAEWDRPLHISEHAPVEPDYQSASDLFGMDDIASRQDDGGLTFVPPSPDELFVSRGAETSLASGARQRAVRIPDTAEPSQVRREPKPPKAAKLPKEPKPPKEPKAAKPPKEPKPPRESNPNSRRALTVVGAMLGLVVVIGGAAAFAVTKLGSDSNATVAEMFPPPATSSAAPTTTAAPIDTFCVSSDDGGVLTTNKAGDRLTGPALIAEFDYQFYVARDGHAVAGFYAPGLMNGDELQSAIDSVPAGTKHCVTVSPGAGPDQYAVNLRVKSPNAASESWDQQITVERGGNGEYSIVSVLQ